MQEVSRSASVSHCLDKRVYAHTGTDARVSGKRTTDSVFKLSHKALHRATVGRSASEMVLEIGPALRFNPIR